MTRLIAVDSSIYVTTVFQETKTCGGWTRITRTQRNYSLSSLTKEPTPCPSKPVSGGQQAIAINARSIN
jgi:hypothetical protein